MGKWKWIQVLSGVIILVSLFLLIYISDQRLVLFGFALWMLALFAIWIWIDRRIQRRKLKDAQDEGHQALIRALTYYRHDWMNDLQVLFGYVQLKKYEQLVSCIDNIREKINSESAINRLGIPSLTAELVEFNAASRDLELRLVMGNEVNLSSLSIQPELIHRLVIDTVRGFQIHSVPGGEPNTLNLTIERMEDCIRFDFEYNGKYRKSELSAYLRSTILENSRMAQIESENELREEEADLLFRIPLFA
ncbi:Spo0B domain-containing protein [Ferviditalea candida]|uniref:Spo0B domain-containing protein n=1 Tax=Ferviditalea candida TaxID=3108399 RepID=A0ABU5ZF99_9BACL|nr:Spo0B domain-containing protein [Paenibacillaceae bacterium T2]